jgi:hypothetical protein
VTPPDYLRGVRDEYCVTGPHAKWQDVITRANLLRALQSDARTDVGNRLDQILISKHDETGRAEFITLEGEHRKTVRGWDFKIIVGRVLGWNVLKSSRFEVARAGTNFVFRGSGFSHGLGLCQEGAHVMAARGAVSKILEKYFRDAGSATRGAARPRPRRPQGHRGGNGCPATTSVSASRISAMPQANDLIGTLPVTYPDVDRRQADQVTNTLESAQRFWASRCGLEISRTSRR